MDILSPKNFSDHTSYKQHIAEVNAFNRREDARVAEHEAWERANAESEAQAEADLPTTSRFDWLSLKSIDEHPLVVTARARLTDAKRTAENVAASISDLRAELARLEKLAARGQRDDSALRAAQSRIDNLASEVRIADAGVHVAEQEVAETWRAVSFAAGANLRAMQLPLVEEFDAALQHARALSRRLADIENASSRLIVPGLYTPKNRRTTRPIRPLAWRKEFEPGGFYDYWRKCALRRPPND
jgi:hypothetical protein